MKNKRHAKTEPDDPKQGATQSQAGQSVEHSTAYDVFNQAGVSLFERAIYRMQHFMQFVTVSGRSYQPRP